MEREEWKSGMMVEDEHVLNFISEIDEAIDKVRESFKDYRPLLNGDRTVISVFWTVILAIGYYLL